MNGRGYYQSVVSLDRRDFIAGGSTAALLALLQGKLSAQEKPKPAAAPEEPKKPVGPPVKCGVIGCGVWGRELINGLLRLPNAPITAICDHYPAFLNRAKNLAPNAKAYASHAELLADKEVEAVLIATPTHQHRALVEAALKAGKHVYCEAPLAHTIEEARAIAKSAKAAVKSNFQSGLNLRSDPQRLFLLPFIRSGAMGAPLRTRAQRNKKESWRRASPNPEREKEINWRLDKLTSAGLIGEIGIHQLDLIHWMLSTRPAAVQGYGRTLQWKDGRTVPDTVHAIFEYANGMTSSYESTLGNSFDGEYEMMYGSDAAIMIRQNKAWMFKEVDSPLLGWEVYARKDQFHKETGIALVANATKLVAQGENATDEVPPTQTPLHFALEAFIANSDITGTAVRDFAENFDITDIKALREYIATTAKSRMPAAGADEGFESAVVAIKAHEATLNNSRIVFQDNWFKIATS